MKRYETRFWGEETSERIGKSGASDVWKRGEVKTTVTQMCLTLCVPKDYMVHGTPQARTLGWVAFPFSRGSSQPRDRTLVFCMAGRFFTNWATREEKSIEYFKEKGWEPERLGCTCAHSIFVSPPVWLSSGQIIAKLTLFPLLCSPFLICRSLCVGSLFCPVSSPMHPCINDTLS